MNVDELSNITIGGFTIPIESVEFEIDDINCPKFEPIPFQGTISFETTVTFIRDEFLAFSHFINGLELLGAIDAWESEGGAL